MNFLRDCRDFTLVYDVLNNIFLTKKNLLIPEVCELSALLLAML